MSDEKDPVRVGRFEWERLMLMSVPHPTNFKLLPLGVFMSADGGRVRPGNAGLAQFGPHEKTWAKLLRWAVAEGWLTQVARGGARRGPNGTTIVRASVYAASVPQPVWERRMEILGAPPFRAAGVEGSAPDPLKGAPVDSPEALKGASDGSLVGPDSLKGAQDAPFNAPDPSLKGAPEDSLPDPLKGAPDGFEGSDPSFEGSVSGFEGSAQTLPHHVVLSSRSNSSSTSSTTSVAEDVPEASAEPTDGGGGGGIHSLEESTKQCERVDAFLATLDFRGKAPGKRQRLELGQRVMVAFSAGWSEHGLKRYLDISDDPNVRSAAALYLHRLSDENLPDSGQAEAVAAGLPPIGPDCFHAPGAATDASLRTAPLGGPCPDCHPDAVRQSSDHGMPPVCDSCVRANPAAQYNVRFRTDSLSFQPGALCPRCHPDMVGAQQPGADGGRWDRAQQRIASGNWKGAGTDERVAGWLAISRQVADSSEKDFAPRPMIAPPRHKPYRNPADQSVCDEDFGPSPMAEPSAYDGDF
ncbi:hypothetical protein [Streptomyces phaeoluteigriseus]|uniref:hypothetical protein n=1 Tax=Streptomyces phaeoluteigriseus TaxID=114686 RepID=UPI0036CAFF57